MQDGVASGSLKTDRMQDGAAPGSLKNDDLKAEVATEKKMMDASQIEEKKRAINATWAEPKRAAVIAADRSNSASRPASRGRP